MSDYGCVFRRACFLLALFIAPAAHAWIGFQPVSPEELKMTGDPNAPGAAAILLYRQVDRDDNGSTSHEDNYFRIKILTEEGRKYADVEIPFVKDDESIVNVKGRTIKPDGSIVNFEGQVFSKSIVKAKGVKYMAKTFTLPNVEPGCIIEYHYTNDLSENTIYDSHWILSDELFTKSARFSLKPYESPYIHLRWSWNHLPQGTVTPKDGADHFVRMEAHNIPAFQTEDYMPPENELKSRVDFIYSEDTPSDNVEEFWKKTGKAMNGRLESFIGKHKAMEQAVAQIVAPSDSPEIKLQKIYAKVQELRNTSFEVSKSQEQQKREKEKDNSSNVEDLWKRGYGNGRDLTWLYLALVRGAGIEAYGVWGSDRENYFFNNTLMDSRKLDANVVLVKLNGKDLYLDPGYAFTPFGLLPWSETGVTGLRMEKDGGSWIQTTLPEAAASTITRKANLNFVADTGAVEGKLTVTYSGLEGMRRRVEERNEDETARKKFLEDDVKSFIPVGSEVDLTNKPDWKSSSPNFVAEFDIKIPGWASSAGRRALIPVGIFAASEKQVFEHTTRVHPMYFEYPSEKIDDITIQIPKGWQVSSMPAARNDDQHLVGYVLQAQNEQGSLHLTRTLKMDVLLLESKYYTALRTFFQTVRTGDEEQIVLQPGTATASN